MRPALLFVGFKKSRHLGGTMDQKPADDLVKSLRSQGHCRICSFSSYGAAA